MLQLGIPKRLLRQSVQSSQTSEAPTPERRSSDASLLSFIRKRHLYIEETHLEEISPELVFEEKKLSLLTKKALVAILDGSIDQIVILGQKFPRPDAPAVIRYQSMEEKYSVQHDTTLYDPTTLQSYSSNEHELETIQFQSNRSYIEALLKMILHELRESTTFEEMQKHLEDTLREKEEEMELVAQVDVKKERMGDMKMLLDEKRPALTAKLQQLADRLAALRKQYEDRLVIGGVEMSYVNRWEDARWESNRYGQKTLEDDLSNSIDFYTTQIDRESRIHEEVMTYLNEGHEDALAKITQWMEDYETATESRDLEIVEMRERLEENATRIEFLTQLYADHKAQIAEYKEVREERRKAQIIKFLRDRAARKIQKWWRNVMIRKHLGPYRKKKGKGKDKKKKKKK